MKTIPTAKSKTPTLRIDTKKESFTIVALGASAGGLEAISAFLQNISPHTGMAYIYVQHLSPDHKSLLTSILSKQTTMKVQEIEDMEKMEPDNVYVIPYNKEIEVTNGHIRLTPRPQNKPTNLSIDVLFSSLALTHHSNVIGIVLSGNGSDGTRGLKEIKMAGGITFAQNKSAKFKSMPESAIAQGVVDFVLSPKEIALEINSLSKHPVLKHSTSRINPEDTIANNDPDLKMIIQLLHKRKSVDFNHYKMNTIKRRMLRRMLIHKTETVKEYRELVSKKNKELDFLYDDLLINVTDFFRDPEAFLVLKKTVLSKLLKSKKPGETLRIWVAACATGEEVYSIAILLIELLDSKTNNNRISFQIFASDLCAEAIKYARNGEYSALQLKNVSPKRLQRFFTKVKDKYQISQALRDACIFANHNVLSDPPFSRMDFISCRNFLIYLEPAAQKKAISTFHYALNDGGCLMLGKSETIGSSSQLFTPLNKTYKIYSRKKYISSSRISDLLPLTSNSSKAEIDKKIAPSLKKTTGVINNTLSNTFDQVLEKYIPASVIINYEMEILQFRGQTALYLMHSPGKASFNILKMIDPEITFELRNAIHIAIKSQQPVKKMGIEVNRDTTKNILQIVNLEVSPVKIEGEEPLLLVVFSGQKIELPEYTIKGKNNNTIAKDRRIKKLEEELDAARHDMAAITRDQEAVNEELQSANEEAISNNEELQSLNEELETSKEEIESTNEELITTNHELQSRIQQTEELYAYYETIIATVHEPMLILDKDMRVKSANNSFYRMFRVNEAESIGQSLYRLGDNHWNIPKLRELMEDILPRNNSFHNFEVEHVFPVIGNKTMLLNAHRIFQNSIKEELIVLTIVDITEVKRLAIELQIKEKKAMEVEHQIEKKALQQVAEINKRYLRMLMESPFAFSIMKGKDMVVTLANDRMKGIWGKGIDVEGQPFMQILPELKDQPLPQIMDKVYTTGIPFYANEMPTRLLHNGKMVDRYFNIVYQAYYEADDQINGVSTITGVTTIAYEVTEMVAARKKMEESHIELLAAKENAELKTEIAEGAVQSKQQFLSNMSHEIRTPLNAIVGFTNAMLKTDLSDKQKEFLEAIKTSGGVLTRLIDDILDLAKVDAGKMAFEKRAFKMEDSISAMLYLFETRIHEKNLKFIKEYDPKIPTVLLGDPVRLHQIILNLLSNAVKFTTSGQISVSVELLREDDETVTIEVAISDTGIGIAEDKLEYIFKNFNQASGGISRLYGGTGLGLAIVKQLVELQGGNIEVKSKLGEGSTFSVSLDFHKTNESIEEEITSISPDSTGMKIRVLVAEDVALNQLLIKTLLADFGFSYDTASDGKIAIEKLKENIYDIILMDLQMPEMNGFEATEYIRNNMNSKIPIIALTADVTTVDLAKCKTYGMDDYISKPVDEKELHRKIVALVKNSTIV